MNNRRSNKPPQVTDHDRLRWERIQEHLDALEALTEAEQEDYLDSACLDPELRREVLAFHRARAASTSYLDDLAESFAPKSVSTPDLSGKRIGAYRLLKLLGRGGMGMVYEAERADGTFEQRVALKLLSTALFSGDVHQRFLAERQILAELEHPSIARILDGGVTGDGTPWFAMERVEGLPIDVYCDRHELDIRQRLELFLQVCDAVEHAHRRLVVHRDLKPANVLVATNDPQHSLSPEGRGSGFEVATVKLLDFGIAKLLDADAAPVTRTSSRMMTPEYASPEQVREEPVTTASDVYQLGLLLYELLTGHRPYVLRHHSAGELERVICEQPPTRLSSAVTREDTIVGGPPDRGPGHASGPISKGRNRAKPEEIGPEGPSTDTLRNTGRDAISALCQARRTSPAKLRRRLRGDLENIVSKALSKEPKRRYGSADRLAQDIRRHLTGLPVNARVDTWAYRSRKFLQRHAVGAAATAAMLVLVAGMTGFYLVDLRRAYEQAEAERIQAQVERDRAETALVRADAEAQKARQVSNFLADIFQSADPQDRAGANISARELVDRGALKVDQELAGQPDVQAEMLRVLGRTYASMSLYDSAQELLTRALELQREHLDPRHPDFARTVSDLGWVRKWQGRFAESRQLQQQAVAILETTPDGDTPEFAEALRRLASTYQSLHESERVLPMLERALSIQENVSGRDSLPVAKILIHMAIQHNRVGTYDEAERALERALSIYERELGTDSGGAGGILVNLASVKANRGYLEDAEAIYRRALTLIENSMGPDHRGMSTVLAGLGMLLTDMQRGDEAIEPLEQSLRIIAGVAPDHPGVGEIHRHLGIAHLTLDDMDQARRHFRHNLMPEEVSPGNDSAGDAARQFLALAWMGWTEILAGDRAVAEPYLTRALKHWHKIPRTNLTADMGRSLRHLSHWLIQERRCTEAKSLLEHSREMRSARPLALDIPVEALETQLAECEDA